MILLRPCKRYNWILVILALCFSGLGVWSLWHFESVSVWTLIVTSVLMLFFLLLSLLPNFSYLVLQKDGFRIRHMFSVGNYKWTDVARFFLGRRFTDRKAVFYQLEGKRLFIIASFPDNYGYTPEKLRELLTLWQDNAVRVFNGFADSSDESDSEPLELQRNDLEDLPASSSKWGPLRPIFHADKPY